MTESPYNSDSDERLSLLKQWLDDTGLQYDRVIAASDDASFRRYFRVFAEENSVIAVDAPPQSQKNAEFIDIAQRLKDVGICTVDVLGYSLENGFLLLQDLGTDVLQQVVSENNEERNRKLYKRAFATIHLMQSEVSTDNLPLYSSKALYSEMQLFNEWYLERHIRHTLNTTDQSMIEEVFALCISSALAQPQAFVHRDYHCRNLMLQKTKDLDNEDLAIIDFQDAVLGPVTYDPVSLLKDAYIRWPAEFIQQHAELHRQSLLPPPDKVQYTRWFDLMGLQRHIKILGVFCRLYYRDNKSRYLNDMPLIRDYILDVTDKYPELHRFGNFLRSLPTT